MSAEVKLKRYHPVHVTLHWLSNPERIYRILPRPCDYLCSFRRINKVVP